jgi:hypothetical protein
MKYLLPGLLSRLLLVAWTASAVAATTTPQQISYQGQLQKGLGNSLSNGVYVIEARIWDNATGGSVMWGMAYPVNVDTNGTFSVNLGDGGGDTKPTPAHYTLGEALDGGPRYLGITVVQTPARLVASPREMTPRTQLLSTPYALHAGMADTALTWKGLEADQIASLAPAATSVSSGTVLGYNGTNMNAMPLTIKSDRSAAAFTGPVTITGGVFQDQGQVKIVTDTIFPRSAAGIALATNVSILHDVNQRYYGHNYQEATDGFLMISWNFDAGAGAGASGSPEYSKTWATLYSALPGGSPLQVVIYSGEAGTQQTDNRGYTWLPVPAGTLYRVDCGAGTNGTPGRIYFQKIGMD